MSTVAVLIAIAIAVAALAAGYAAGRAGRKPAASPVTLPSSAQAVATNPAPEAQMPVSVPLTPAPVPDSTLAEHARIMRSFEAEAAMLRQALAARDATLARLADLAVDRERLYGDLANARGESARFRQLVIDLENNAPPPFFGIGAPDDLKLIVGVGPVLERMLQQLGITTYRQIARWTEHDIDEFDAKLPEFPGRIRRDTWVTQARALHQSKYGVPPPLRERS